MSNNNTPQDIFTPNTQDETPSEPASTTPALASLVNRGTPMLNIGTPEINPSTPIINPFASANSARFTPLPNSSQSNFQNPSQRRNNFAPDMSSPLVYPNTQGSNQSPFLVNTQRFTSTPRVNPGSSQLFNDFDTPRMYQRGDVNPVGLTTSYGSSSVPNNNSPMTPLDININLNNVQGPVAPSGDTTQVIWGTTVNVHDCMNQFSRFLNEFKREDFLKLNNLPVLEEDLKPYYIEHISSIVNNDFYNLDLDCQHLLSFEPTIRLYSQLKSYPQEIIPLMDYCLTNFCNELLENNYVRTIQRPLRVRPFNLGNSVNMRELNPKDIDQLVSIKGLLIRASSIIPDIKKAYFQCKICDRSLFVEITSGIILEPTKCPEAACQTPNSMVMIHNRCIYADKQISKLQETPDIIPDGQTPHSVSLCLYDELVDSCKPGDRLEVTGVFRSTPVRVNPRKRTVKALFKTYIDVVHIKTITYATKNEASTNNGTRNNARISEREVAEFEELARSEDVYERLANSIAPSIYGMTDVKKGILLQMFGGESKLFTNTNQRRARGDIHILLVGDPGTSKSQMLQYAHRIAPRGMYTSGKGSSAVGLTAYITRDPDTNQLVLESGALVLSDGGLCCIDEFDKMSDGTRSILHEVMEQQTVSVAKAGIITTLNARTSILASANPINSSWLRDLSVPQNINLPPSLLSRFDLIYLILDKVNPDEDRRLAQHLVSLYINSNESLVEGNYLPTHTLSRYVQYAKSTRTEITDEASNKLVKNYVELRNLGKENYNQETRITATTRQLESLIRLSEAHAKMRLSQYVEEMDVEEAFRLLRAAIHSSATNPKTGKIELDQLVTGISSETREIRKQIQKAIVELLGQSENPVQYSSNQLITILKNNAAASGLVVTKTDFEEAINELVSKNFVLSQGSQMRGGQRMLTRNFDRGFILEEDD
ncbi:MCM-domain-containing protein [Neoconidiobolus thromboides FSU 785]|nr:MCM-domain-containing protein [Neoconidiobolus thromboides FSU 785]